MRYSGLLCVAIVAATWPLYAAEYVVSPDGADTNPGTPQRPFRTIGRAAEAMKAGDTCTVRAGTYRETVVVKKSGLPDRPIRFRAAPGEQVFLVGTELTRSTVRQIRGRVLWLGVGLWAVVAPLTLFLILSASP